MSNINTQLFKKILDALPNNVYFKDSCGRYVWLNQSCVRLLSSQHQIQSSIINKTDFDLFPEKNATEYVKNDKAVMQSRLGTVVEEEVLLPAGDHLVQLSFKEPLIDEKTDEVLGIVGYTIDISDRKRAEKELIKAKEAAEVANKAKQQFMYNMRHDIRTPFTGILGIADHLRRNEPDPNRQQMLNMLHQATNELLSYMNEILELTQVEEGQLPVVSQLLNLKALGQQCADICLPAAKDKALDFLYEYDDRLPTHVLSDEFRLKRILINLLGNAVKFTPAGRVTLRMTLEGERLNSDDILVAISVKDTGVGVPKDKQAIIFEKFERLTPSYQGKYKGSGLGLFAVRALMDELQGDIELNSIVDEGSTFICHIPMKKRHTQGFQAPQQSFSASKPIATAPQELIKQPLSPRVLFVEDSVMVKLGSIPMLESLNATVDAVDSGEEALEHIKLQDYDLVFMDIGLPGIDGYETTRRIRTMEKGKTIPIIAVTAHAMGDVKPQCDQVGMTDVIQKPLTPEDALTFFNTHLYAKGYLMNESMVLKKKEDPYKHLFDMTKSIVKLGSEAAVKNYLKSLVVYLTDSLTLMITLEEKKDSIPLAKEAHKLKGALSLIEAPELSQAAVQLNNGLKIGQRGDIPALLAAVIEAADLFKQHVTEKVLPT